MYLFGNTDLLPMYDLIGILGYLIIIGITFSKKSLTLKSHSLGTLSLYLYNHADIIGKTPRKREMFASKVFWAKKERMILFVVHLFTFTFGGELFGSLIGRRTDFLGYIGATTIAICIVCYFLGCNVLQELDNLVPIFLSVAALLKIGCFCAGCCNGMEWEYGMLNHCTAKYEFPIQLVESLFYLILLLALRFCKRRIPCGYISPIFWIIYASFRFLIQFFRTDRPIFSSYHLLSVYALVFGIAYLFIVYKYGRVITAAFCRKVSIPFIEAKCKRQ